jgi:hypothetical protein
VNLNANDSAAIDLFIDRRDGFDGPVRVAAVNLPEGVSAEPALIGTSTRWGTLVLKSAAEVKPFTGSLTLQCQWYDDPSKLQHVARAAGITWSVQRNANRVAAARLEQQLMLAVRPQKCEMNIKLDFEKSQYTTKDVENKDSTAALQRPIFAKPGDKIALAITTEWQAEGARPNPIGLFMQPIHPNVQQTPLIAVNGNDPNNPAVNIPKEQTAGTITIDVRQNAQPGLYPVVIRAETLQSYSRNPEKKDQKTNGLVYAYSEPIEVRVVPKSVGKLTLVLPPDGKLARGGTTAVKLKVERLNNYTGPFELTPELPKEAEGITVKPLTLPAEVNEIDIPVEVAADAKDIGNFILKIQAKATLFSTYVIEQSTQLSGLRVPKANK